MEAARGEARSGLIAAYRAEPARVRFLPQEPDSAPAPTAPGRDDGPQGAMLAVVWGDGSSDVRVWNAWSHHRAAAEGVTPPEPNDVFFALARGVLYAFDPDGRLLWARRLGIDSRWLPRRIDLSPPAVLAVSTEDNTLVALHESTGELRWKYRVGQDIVAPPTIVRRAGTPDGPRRDCGLLPTADGEIRALELVLGRPLGRYRVGPPLTVGGAYDPRTGLVFFAADARRIFAIDPAAIDNADRPACRAVLFTQHAGGAIRGTPRVVGRLLIVAEDAGVETTRLRAYAVARSGALEPTAPPRNNLTMPGWNWFEPHCTPDRLTLVTDRGHLGMFGLNLDDADGALYRLVPEWNVEEARGARPLAVHAEDHRVWLLADGSLQQLAVDVRRQSEHFPEIQAAAHKVHEHVAESAIVIPLWQLGTYVAVAPNVVLRDRDGNAADWDPFDPYGSVPYWELKAE